MNDSILNIFRQTKPIQAIIYLKTKNKIMREGIIFSLSATIPRNTWLANFVLIFYILTFSLILYQAYRNKAEQAEKLANQTAARFRDYPGKVKRSPKQAQPNIEQRRTV